MGFSDYWSPLTGFGKATGIEDKGKETVTLEPMKEKWQMDLGKLLAGLSTKGVSRYEPGKAFPRISELTTPSSFEQQGLDYLQKYISGGIQPEGIQKQAQDVLSKTLGGEYDPFTSEYYKSQRLELEKERKMNIKRLNQQISKAGLGGSSYRAGRIGDIGQENFDRISELLAVVQQAERQNQLDAVPTALDFGNTMESQIQNKLSTIMGAGALPRELEGVGYKDFLRKQGDYQSMAELAKQLFGYNIPYGKKSLDYQTPSMLDTLLGYGSQLAQLMSKKT